MQVLICAGDVLQAAEIRDAVEEIIEKDRLTLCFTSRTDVQVVRTKDGSRAEMLVYFLPDWKAEKHMQYLDALRGKLVERLSLTDSQVICAIKFP